MTTHDTEAAPRRSVTRRALLKGGGGVALTLAFPGEVLARRRPWRAKSHLRRSVYHRLVGQRFSVRGSRTVLRLAHVRDLNRHQTKSENAFALIFQAPRGAPLLQPVPELYHPQLGHFELFMTAGQPGRSQPYVGIINRLHA